MKKNVTALPEAYKQAVKKELQGTLTEISYSVKNYINQSRQFVTNQNISVNEAGRETVQGDEITKQCYVYLPSSYDKNDKETKYNVLYLLHGVGGSRYEWLSDNGEVDENYIICNIFDHLIANHDIEPLIVVFPDDRSASDWTDRTFNLDGTNLLGFYYFDYEMKHDLIPFIESQYHTFANIKDKSSDGIAYNRLHRAIAGLSMGGMQSLNLVFGGYRCDSAAQVGTLSPWGNGLATTVPATGMINLFAYVGAFSNAPTSSEGKVLGAGIATGGHRIHLLYITCGSADDVAYPQGYVNAVNGLEEASGDNLGDFYRVIIKDGIHDFNVWNNGAYNYVQLCFGETEGHNRFDVSM